MGPGPTSPCFQQVQCTRSKDNQKLQSQIIELINPEELDMVKVGRIDPFHLT